MTQQPKSSFLVYAGPNLVTFQTSPFFLFLIVNYCDIISTIIILYTSFSKSSSLLYVKEAFLLPGACCNIRENSTDVVWGRNQTKNVKAQNVKSTVPAKQVANRVGRAAN